MGTGVQELQQEVPNSISFFSVNFKFNFNSNFSLNYNFQLQFSETAAKVNLLQLGCRRLIQYQIEIQLQFSISISFKYSESAA